MREIIKTLIDDGLMTTSMGPYVTFMCVLGLALWGVSIVGGGDDNAEE